MADSDTPPHGKHVRRYKTEKGQHPPAASSPPGEDTPQVTLTPDRIKEIIEYAEDEARRLGGDTPDGPKIQR